jgi:hypothetical protein
MDLSLDNDIREGLASYLLGEYSLEDFKDWFIPVLLDVDQSENQKAINMAYEIELRLSEYSNGYWNEDELKQLFRPLVEFYEIEIDISSGPKLSANAQQNYRALIPHVSFHILHSKIL